MDSTIRIAESDSEIEACYPILCQLHEDLPQTGFTEQVHRLMQNGYRLVSLTAGETVRGVAGFHLGESFAWKRYLYVDDLVTDAKSRGKGYGTKLVAWLFDYAYESGCEQLHLDSRVTRYATHKFYFNRDLYIGGYHFLVSLDGSN